MSVHLMKQKSAKTSSKIKLVLFTVVQMAVIAWLIVTGKNVSPTIRVLMGIASLIWAGQTVFSYGCYKARAKMMLTNQADNDKSGDFWKEHRLQLQGNKVNIHCAGVQPGHLVHDGIAGREQDDRRVFLLAETAQHLHAV